MITKHERLYNADSRSSDTTNTPPRPLNTYLFEDYPDLVGVSELREMLGGIGQNLAYRLLKEQIIPSIRIGRAYKIAKLNIIHFVLSKPDMDTSVED